MAQRKYEKWLEPENLTLLQGWARRGLTDADIAHNIGVKPQTLCEWKKQHPEIGEALKRGAEIADIIIENSLFQAATGYYVEETEDKLNEIGEPVKCNKRRWIAGNVTAQIFWLKNRRPDLWRDRPAQETAQDTSGLQDFIRAITPSRTEVAQIFTDTTAPASMGGNVPDNLQ